MRPRRRFALSLHRALGVTVGAVLVLTALSGSLIVFGWSADAWLNAELFRPDTPFDQRQGQSVSTVLAAARAALPAAARVEGLNFPRPAAPVYRVHFTLEGDRDGYELFVEPTTATVLGQRLWGDFDPCCSAHGPLMAVIYRFHDSLWLGDNGLAFIGSVGLTMTFALLLGLGLWWPARSGLRKALRLRLRASVEKRCYDLHNVAGVIFAPVLLLLLLTGAYLSFPAQGRALLGIITPLSPAKPAPEQTFRPGLPELSIDRLIAVAASADPPGRLDALYLPEPGSAVYEFTKHVGDEPMDAISRVRIAIDGQTGAIIQTDGTTPTVGDRLDAWILALHSGEGLGLPGRSLVLVTGLIPPLLFITGWLRRRQKRLARRRRHHL